MFSIAADMFVVLLTLWILYALLSVAFSLGFRVGGFFDLSVGVSFLVGAYATWSCSKILPIILSGTCGILLAGILAVVIGRWLVVPLAVRLSPLALFVATLAILYIAQSLSALAFGTSALVLQTGPTNTAKIGPTHITYVQLLFGCVVTVALFGLYLWLRAARWGRFARAVADDRSLATLFGIPIEKTVFRCYAASGIFAGLAGTYFVADRAIDPTQALIVLLSSC